MIEHRILLILALFFAMALLYLLSQRLRISYPIFLVIGGLAVSFIPGAPVITVDPDMVFLIFLPPLLFEAAWYTISASPAISNLAILPAITLFTNMVWLLTVGSLSSRVCLRR